VRSQTYVFQAARPLAGTKLYCLVTEAHVCKQLAQGCTQTRSYEFIFISLVNVSPSPHPLIIPLHLHLFCSTFLLSPFTTSLLHLHYFIPFPTLLEIQLGLESAVSSRQVEPPLKLISLCKICDQFYSYSDVIREKLNQIGPRAGSEVVRIDPLRFLAGCLKRRLNQALSVLSLSLGFFWCMCCAVN